MRSDLGRCKVCGWHGMIIRHKPDVCARYMKIKGMYLSGMSSREIGREIGTSFENVLNALKAGGVKIRRPGGLNNPTGKNGRMPRDPSGPIEVQKS